MSIYATGLDSDGTMVHFLRTATAAGHDVTFVNLHAAAAQPWQFPVDTAASDATVHQVDGTPLPLPAHGRYYSRAVDLSPVLPPPQAMAWRHLLSGLSAFLDAAPGLVVNRPGGHCHNGSKPLHEWWLGSRGFAVPPSETTSDRSVIRSFLARHGPSIVKAVCGARGQAQIVTESRFADFVPEAGPVHLQRVVPGYDVRVHLVGDRPFAERIDSEADDYRAVGARPRFQPATVPERLLPAMVAAAGEMGLPFTGWDFRVDPDGTWWCLEVNSMPGYGYYDERLGGAITAALCGLLLNAPAD